MKKINIVLYCPEIPQNTGNISRTAAVTGAALHIIKPLGFEISDRTLKRAGLDYWDKLDIEQVESLQKLKEENKNSNFYYFTTKTDRIYTKTTYKQGDFLVFGPETRGLPEEILNSNKETCVTIPMRKETRSLNLSNSVAIAAYEAYRQFSQTSD